MGNVIRESINSRASAKLLAGVVGCFCATGCLTSVGTRGNISTSATVSTSATPTYSVPTGAKAVKIIFRQATSGSFDAPSSGGTLAQAGGGLAAKRIFNADDTLLASGTVSTSSSWPKWFQSLELGISGSSNASAKDPDCARFSASGEDAELCDFDDNTGTAGVACGAPEGFYRVSEYDCVKSSSTRAATGSGSSTDGVYFRVTLSRSTDYLGSGENLMAVLEYAASALNAAPLNPTTCFASGQLKPENAGCADMVWRAYLKPDANSAAAPFLLIVPPALASVNKTTNTGGSGVTARQFVIPLASYPTIQVIQFSRVTGVSSTGSDDYYRICGNSSGAANSALCVGMVFYSLTLYRI